MDNSIQTNIDLMIKKDLYYFYSEIERLNLKGKANMYFLSAIPSIPTIRDVESHIKILVSDNPTTLYTSAQCTISEVIEYDKNDVIVGIRSNVYVTFQSLYEYIINCRGNFLKAFESLIFDTRHEIGHVLSDRQMIGHKKDEWEALSYNQDAIYSSFKKLRKNTSYENRLKWYLDFNKLSSEKEANDFMGITEEELIENYKRLHVK